MGTWGAVTNGQEIQNRAVQSASCGPSAIFLASHQAKNEVKYLTHRPHTDTNQQHIFTLLDLCTTLSWS